MSSFALNDPVTVTTEDGAALEGAVVWISPDNRYGIRLLGSSVGKGANPSEFSCPDKCGLIVPESQLQVRSLTKLEQLRLKRELRTTTASSSSTPATATTTTTRTTTPPRTAAATTATPATASRSKLDELRLKRAALQKERDAAASASTTPAASPRSTSPVPVAPPANTQELDALRQQLQTQTERAQSLDTKVQQLEQQAAVAAAAAAALQAKTKEDTTAPLRAELARLQTQLSTTQSQLATSQQEAAAAKASLAAQPPPAAAPPIANYKEHAALQAQLSTAQQQLERLALEKLELENKLEDQTVEVEFVQARHEELQDKYEEAVLDAQANQLALEEAQLELEEQQSAGMSLGDGANDDLHVLQAHTTKLRAAVLKLREQAGVTQLAHQRELRQAQAEAATAAQTAEQAAQARTTQLETEILDLKEMVEQGAAYESMVEDLSDRLMQMEEDSTALRVTIQELEEAAELTAEMEEVAAEELRALNLDLQGRDSMVQNLEEAIRMQRRREDDFKRTVGKYKNAVETLQQEKEALMGMFDSKNVQENASQKALAKAAQWVADAARTRRGQAQAVVDAVAVVQLRHVSTRVEALLPPAAAGVELTAIKGEVATSTTLSKVAHVLDGIEQIFTKEMRPQVQDVKPPENSSAVTMSVNDDAKQRIRTLFHQMDFCNLLLEASSDWMRCLLAGQWPDLLPPDISAELGSSMGHAIHELDFAVSHVLRMLKEEGELSVDQCNIGDLQLAVSTSLQDLRGEMERKEGPLVPSDWNPTCLQVFHHATRAKLHSVVSAASFAAAMEGNEESCGTLYNKLEQCASQTVNACARLTHLDVQNEKLVDELGTLYMELAKETEALRGSVNGFVGQDTTSGYSDCLAAADAVLRRLMQLLPVLRSEKLNADSSANEKEHHALSPESVDPWTGISTLVRSIRGSDGDSDDINALLRGHLVEERLSGALDKEPQLELAQAKVASLEKVRTLWIDICVRFSHPLICHTVRRCRRDPRRFPCKTHA